MVTWAEKIQVMTDVSKYIEHIEEEEKRSHPFGVTNVLLNGLNGRKSKTTLDTGRSLTWIFFFCLVLGICGVIIYLSARGAGEVRVENCKIFKISCSGVTDDTKSTNDDVKPVNSFSNDTALMNINLTGPTSRRKKRSHIKPHRIAQQKNRLGQKENGLKAGNIASP